MFRLPRRPSRPALPVLLVLLAGGLAAAPAGSSVLRPAPWDRYGGQAGAAFGQAVAPAGDVDADGWGDLLVGAPGWDGTATNAGAAFLFRGGPDGLAASPAWTFLGTQTSSAAGTTVAPAGDVNNDGYADVLVGAPLYNGAGGADHGRVYVFLGGPGGLAASPSQTLTGAVIGGQFGQSLAPAGDVNGDGYDDVIIGAPLVVNSLTAEGAAYAYLGGAGGLTGPTWTRFGGAAVALFGYAVSGAGDVDGDGYADVIVGAPGRSVSFTRDGAAYVYRGSAGGLLTSIAASLHGGADSAAFGAAVSLAGDVNGDGYADVLVGAPNRKFSGIAYGEAQLHAGAPGGLGAVLWVGQGTTARSYFGASVATAGDLDGDCRADFVIGADRWPQPSQRQGQAFVHLGREGTPVLDAQFDGAATGQALGVAVATAGDVDGDGFSDLVYGEPGVTGTLAGEGRVTLLRGGASKPVPGVFWPRTDGEPGALLGHGLAGGIDVRRFGSDWFVAAAPLSDQGFTNAGRLHLANAQIPSPVLDVTPFAGGDRAEALLGIELARAGDVNGDGYEDLIAGSPTYSNGHVFEGVAQLFYGGAAGFAAAPGWSYEGNALEAEAGISVAGGDFNGDGFADVAVGLFSDVASGRDGSARVFYGSPLGPPASPSWTSPAVAGDTWFGFEVATGDWDGDGYTDLAVGAPNETSGEFREGRVYVFFGGPAGLDPAPSWVLEANQVLGGLGYAIANAGDVDGDGVSDLLVGAPGSLGRAYVFSGSPSRSQPELRRARVIEPDVPAPTFGQSVAGIGDLDKDGFGDFLVGAPQYSGGETNEGRVWLFRGSIEGGERTPWWSAESNLTDARFGTCLARLGDPNADGWPDFAVGSPYQGPGGTVHVFEGGGRGLPRFVGQRIPGVVNGYLWMTGTSTHPSATECESGLRSAAGRVKGYQELHVRTQRESWAAGTRQVSGPYDSGAPQFGFGSVRVGVSTLGGLVPGIVYVWRERSIVRSPHFPHTPWSQPRAHETGEHHFRMPGSVVAVPPPAARPATVRLAGIEPSPFREGTRIRYALPRDGAVVLDVFDGRGRHVRRLAGGPAAAGEHAAAFDGRDDHGRPVAAGVYFVALALGGERDVRKVVRLP